MTVSGLSAAISSESFKKNHDCYNLKSGQDHGFTGFTQRAQCSRKGRNRLIFSVKDLEGVSVSGYNRDNFSRFTFLFSHITPPRPNLLNWQTPNLKVFSTLRVTLL